MFTVMMSLDYVAENRIPGAEYYSLLLFSALGMMLMATAGDLIVIFLGLETMSITVYVLAGMMRRNAEVERSRDKIFSAGRVLDRLPALRNRAGVRRDRLDQARPDPRRPCFRRVELEPAAAARHRHAGDRFRLQGRRGAVSHVDARRLRRRADAGDRVHGGGREARRVRRLRPRFPGRFLDPSARTGRPCCG